MKHCLLLILPLWVAATSVARSQIASAEFPVRDKALAHSSTSPFKPARVGLAERHRPPSSIDFTDFSSAFSAELFLGGSASLASGDFIDYQRSFHDVVETGTVVEGAIQPIFMVTGGVQARLMPFDDDVLENLGVSFGFQYVQKGFVNQFSMTYTSPTDYTDVTEFRETYRHHYLALPLQFRWGLKWFGTLGFSFYQHLGSTKAQELDRKQSGPGAVNGGFENSSTESKKLDQLIVAKSHTVFMLGGGYQFSEGFAVAARANFGGSVLLNPDSNYSTTLFELFFVKSLKF